MSKSDAPATPQRVSRTIPLHDIIGRSPRNCRASLPDDDLAGTMASIDSVGQLQALLVAPVPDQPPDQADKFWIDDGGRRWQAMCALRDAGRLEADYPVDCDVLVGADESFAREASLQANLNRRELHPVDQCAAFHDLVEAGCSVETVAIHFAITVRIVNQRLRLRRLSDRVRAAWRDGKMSAEAAAAFTAGAGHAEQDALLDEMSRTDFGPNAFNPVTIRMRLRKDAVRADSVEARFVGLDAYVAAGGTVDDNLFEDFAVCRDGALLKRLVRTKLLAQGGEAIAALGLGSVCLREDLPDYPAWTALPREYSVREAAALDDGDLDLAGAIVIEVKAIARKATPAQMVATTLVMYLDGDGPHADVGMVAPGQARAAEREASESPRAAKAGGKAGATGGKGGTAEAEMPRSERPLIEAIDAARTAGAAEALIASPSLALRVAIAALQARSNHGPVRIATTARNAFVGTLPHGGFAQALDALVHEYAKTSYSVVVAWLADVVAESLVFAEMDRDATVLLAAIAAVAPSEYRNGAREVFNYAGYIGALAKDKALAVYQACGGLPADARKLTRLALTEATVAIARDKEWLPSELDLPPPDTRLVPATHTPADESPPPLAEVMVRAIEAHEAEQAAEEILVGPVGEPIAPQLAALDAFLAARTRRRDEAKVKASVLFDAYRSATTDPLNQAEFGRAIALLGIGKHRTKAGWHYVGIELT